MAKSGSLQDAFVDELRDAYHAERQVLKALPKMIKKARPGALRDTLAAHLEGTKAHVERLEMAFGSIGEKVRGKRCEGMAGIISESKAVMKEDFDEPTMEACLVAAAQRVQHYKMTAYGTLIAWARTLGHVQAVALLTTSLQEATGVDATLSSLAESGLSGLGTDAAPVSDEPADPADKRAKKAHKRGKKPRQ